MGENAKLWRSSIVSGKIVKDLLMADTVLIVITQTFGSTSWMVGPTSLSLSWEENVCQILYDLNHLGIFHTSLAMWIFLSRVKTSYIHYPYHLYIE